MNKKLILSIGAGFVVGGVLGFMWSQSVKSNLSKSVTTKTEGSKVIVTVDMLDAVTGGITDYFDKKGA